MWWIYFLRETRSTSSSLSGWNIYNYVNTTYRSVLHVKRLLITYDGVLALDDNGGRRGLGVSGGLSAPQSLNDTLRTLLLRDAVREKLRLCLDPDLLLPPPPPPPELPILDLNIVGGSRALKEVRGVRDGGDVIRASRKLEERCRLMATDPVLSTSLMLVEMDLWAWS